MSYFPLRNRWYDCGIKRTLDFVFSLTILLLLSPLLLVVAILLKLLQPGSILFFQKRVGYRCKTFHIYKFRTMIDAVDADGDPLPDEERVTAIGKILRATSLDELPELFNILLGDMSLVGPRPWIPEQMGIFAKFTQSARMSVRPGLSGLAQVLGRNNLTFRQRVACDLRYIRHQSFSLDMGIVFWTFYTAIKREGIAQRPDALDGKPISAPRPKNIVTRFATAFATLGAPPAARPRDFMTVGLRANMHPTQLHRTMSNR